MKSVVLRFEELPRELREDAEFGPIIKGVKVKTRNDYLLQNDYLFFGNLLCILNTSLQFAIVQEIHKQDHFGAKKTLHLICEKFFWPGMLKDIKFFYEKMSNLSKC
jgi:Integrase zinc binding domain